MVVMAVLLTVNLVAMTRPVPVCIYYPAGRRFYNDNAGWWWRTIVVPVTVPITVIIPGAVRAVSTG
jgi:hypothetical protein